MVKFQGVHWKTPYVAIRQFLSTFGKKVELSFQTTSNYRLFKGQAKIFEPRNVRILLGKNHEVLTSNLKFQQYYNKKEEKAKESHKFFVGGLGSKVTERFLYTYFSKVGRVKDVSIMKNRMNLKSRGFGFVTFALGEDVQPLMAADSTYHQINGVTVECRLAVKKEDMLESRFLGMLAEEKGRMSRCSTLDTCSGLSRDRKTLSQSD